jgi:hypothetical protein
MDIFSAVAGNVFTQFFELPAFADLPMLPKAKHPASQEKSGDIAPLQQEIGIHPQFALQRQSPPHVPEPKPG